MHCLWCWLISCALSVPWQFVTAKSCQIAYEGRCTTTLKHCLPDAQSAAVANDVATGATNAAGTVRNATVGAYDTVSNGAVDAYNTVANGTVGVYNDAVNGANRTAQNALGINSAEHLSAVRIGAIVAALPLAMWALL